MEDAFNSAPQQKSTSEGERLPDINLILETVERYGKEIKELEKLLQDLIETYRSKRKNGETNREVADRRVARIREFILEDLWDTLDFSKLQASINELIAVYKEASTLFERYRKISLESQDALEDLKRRRERIRDAMRAYIKKADDLLLDNLDNTSKLVSLLASFDEDSEVVSSLQESHLSFKRLYEDLLSQTLHLLREKEKEQTNLYADKRGQPGYGDVVSRRPHGKVGRIYDPAREEDPSWYGDSGPRRSDD